MVVEQRQVVRLVLGYSCPQCRESLRASLDTLALHAPSSQVVTKNRSVRRVIVNDQYTEAPQVGARLGCRLAMLWLHLQVYREPECASFSRLTLYADLSSH